MYFPCVDDTGSKTVLVPKSDASMLNGTETILLVEDNDAVRGLAQASLERRGYRVLEASSGADALRVSELQTQPIDLLVTDVVMPRMNGWALFEHLTTRRPSMKVLFMSGYAVDATVRPTIDDRRCGFLQKPVTPEGLTRKVRMLLDAG